MGPLCYEENKVMGGGKYKGGLVEEFLCKTPGCESGGKNGSLRKERDKGQKKTLQW